MRLSELEPNFVRYACEPASSYHGRPLPDGTMQWGGFDTDIFYPMDSAEGADGISFECPACRQHSIHIYFRGSNVPDRLGKDSQGNTVRWDRVKGSTYDDLTLQPSILVKFPCGWHGYITDGEVSIL